MSVGERIKEARKKTGLKQSDLAEKLGVAVITIGQYERDQRQPRLEALRQIAQALGTTVSDLVEPGYWSTLADEDKKDAFLPDAPLVATLGPSARERVETAMEQMTQDGQNKVADYAEDILPRYRAQERGKASPEGTDTTPPSDGPQRPQEGK